MDERGPIRPKEPVTEPAFEFASPPTDHELGLFDELEMTVSSERVNARRADSSPSLEP